MSLDNMAYRIISELYRENSKYIRQGHFDCKFADVAFRYGNLLVHDDAPYQQFDNAYKYYLQAQYAIKMRIQCGNDYYGDGSVAGGIDNAIAGIVDRTSYAQIVDSFMGDIWDVAEMLEDVIYDGYAIELKYKKLKRGQYSLTFKPVPRFGDLPKIFITAPECAFCDLVDKIHVNTKTVDKCTLEGEKGRIVFDEFDGCDLMLHGKYVATVDAEVKFRFATPSR